MKLATITAFVLFLVPLSVAAQAPMKPSGDTAMESAKPPVPPSKSVNVISEGKAINLTLDDLLSMPQVTVRVHNAHRNTEETYSGPLLADVLARVGLKASRETEPLILHSSLFATGTDHYFVVYSVAEVEPSFNSGQVIVAVMKSGLPNTEGGIIELVNTLDAKLHGETSHPEVREVATARPLDPRPCRTQSDESNPEQTRLHPKE
jgi:hypothetical protein